MSIHTFVKTRPPALVRSSSVNQKDRPLTVHDLYPGMSDAWYAEAEVTLGRILSHSLTMYERLQQDPQAVAEFRALTASRRYAEMKSKRSTPSNGESSPHHP